MRIDFYRPLLDFSGEVLRDGDRALALSVVAVNALMGVDADEQTLMAARKSVDTSSRLASMAPMALSTFLPRTSPYARG